MTRSAPQAQVLHGGSAVEHLSVSVYRVPTDLPGGDATLSWDSTTLVLAEVTAAGESGIGFTYGSAATAHVIEQELAGLVVGHDTFDIPAANDRMSRALRNTARPGIAAGAVSAVDTAVLEIATDRRAEPLAPRPLWEATERWWKTAVPGCAGTAAPRDTRMAYAVLTGLTSRSGGMVAAATTSLPERADSGRDYDYRYAWIRDQCYAGIAVAAHGPHPLLTRAVRFVADRVLEDGAALRPAYTVTGEPLPEERDLPFVGYPGGGDRTGNRAGRQFQLDVFGEALQLFAAAARHDALDSRASRAATVAVRAVAERWARPDAGLWELDGRWWTHSRLCCVVGLRELSQALRTPASADWARLADRVLEETRARCLHTDGHWQRADDDPGPGGGAAPAPGTGSRVPQ